MAARKKASAKSTTYGRANQRGVSFTQQSKFEAKEARERAVLKARMGGKPKPKMKVKKSAGARGASGNMALHKKYGGMAGIMDSASKTGRNRR